MSNALLFMVKRPKAADELFLGPPFGLYRLKFFLEQHGHHVDVVDPNIDDFDIEQSTNYDLIGITSYHETLENDLDLMERVRKQNPNIPLIAGGIEARNNYEQIMRLSSVDVVVLGEGEYPLLQMLNLIDVNGFDPNRLNCVVVRSNDGFKVNQGIQLLSKDEFAEVTLGMNFSKIPYDKYWENIRKRYADPNEKEIRAIRLFTGSYCSVGCKFCSHAGESNRHMTSEKTLELIVNATSQRPDVETIIFDDDNYTLYSKEITRTCELITEAKEEGYLPEGLEFICMSRVNDVCNEQGYAMLKAMKKAGFRLIIYGVESFSDQVLKDIGKKTTSQQNEEAIRRTLQVGMKPLLNLILFAPSIDIEGLIRTMDKSMLALEQGAEISINEYCWCWPGSQWYNDDSLDVVTETKTVAATGASFKKKLYILPKDQHIRTIIERSDDLYADLQSQLIDQYSIQHFPKRYRAIMRFYSLYSALGEEYKPQQQRLYKLLT